MPWRGRYACACTLEGRMTLARQDTDYFAAALHLAARLRRTEQLAARLFAALLHAEDALLNDVPDDAPSIAPTRADVRAAIEACETWDYAMATPDRLREHD